MKITMLKIHLTIKVLVIDEIHNLTSSMAGNGYNGARLYELIMRAKNLKLFFYQELLL